MRIPPYWTRESYTGLDRNGKKRTYSAYGWSFDSFVAARRDAQARAQRIFFRITAGQKPDLYSYLDQPLREEVVSPVTNRHETIGFITRNRYGALVLNSSSVLFADIDFPEDMPKSILAAVGILFSKKNRNVKSAEERTVESVKKWHRNNSRHSFRVYRTHSGLRLLFTDRLYTPSDQEAKSILRSLGCDPLYLTLTEKQQCFRARLTPKPWRCDCPAPWSHFPFTNSEEERSFRDWEREYSNKSQKYATCRLLEVIGLGARDEEIGNIVRLHDQYTCKDHLDNLA